MKVEELIKTIRDGPHDLTLDSPLQVEHSVGFSEFLWALSTSTNIRRIYYHGSLDVYLSMFEKEQVIEAFGSMKGLEEISFLYGVNISPKALASTLRRLKSLRVLRLGIGCRFTRTSDPDMQLVASSLQLHPSLERFLWVLRQHFDPVIAQALATCPRLTHMSLCQSGIFTLSNGIRFLAASNSLRSVHLRSSSEWEPFSKLLDDKCTSGTIKLTNFAITHVPRSSDQQLTIQDITAVTQYIQGNTTLEVLDIDVKGDFTDEMGIVLARAIQHNKGMLRSVNVSSVSRKNRFGPQSEYTFDESAYRAFYESLQNNHNLVMTININSTDKRLQKIADAKSNVNIMSKLNSVGRGRLRRDDVTKYDWLHVLCQINQDFESDEVAEEDEIDGAIMALSCIYSIVRMNPLSLLG